ncbi:MAG: glycosyltransferase family 2 protein [Jhaorihella sp.]
MATPPPSIILAACMRNEGLFLMEWLAHHAALGFDRIVVVTNDCTDGSDLLLDRLNACGIVTHIRQSVSPGANPQETGMDHVLALCRTEGHTHVLHLDSDEFLDLDKPRLGIRRILEIAPDADIIPFAWRFFGDGGKFAWTPGDLLIEQNPRAERKPDPATAKCKCLFRVASFARAGDHAPMDPLVAEPVVRTPDGRPLNPRSLIRQSTARWRPYTRSASGRGARLSHYAVRSLDVFLMKNDRGKGTGAPVSAKYHAGRKWYETCNRNGPTDTRMPRYLAGIRRILALWRADPETARREQACFDWFLARREALLTPERLEAWVRTKDSP